MLRLFVNILTAEDKYFLLDRDNLTQSNQILLSQKQKTFSLFLSAFFKSTLNFPDFPKKDEHHSKDEHNSKDEHTPMYFGNSRLLKKRLHKCL